MISLNHVLVGTAIGLAVKQPALAAPLAFASHFVLDAIPHFSYEWPGWKFRTIWAIDAVTSLAAIILLSMAAPQFAPAIIAGGVFAELPDTIWIYDRWIIHGKSQHWFFRFHRFIQWSQTQPGLFYEVGYLCIFVLANLWLLSHVR